VSETPSPKPVTTETITTERKGGAIVARPQVKMMDDDALKALARVVDEAGRSDPDATLVILDLSRVAIVPSLGLGLLVQILNKCKARQQRLKLVGVQPQIRQVFSITKLDRIFHFADSVDAAME
jgi:anti-sigma B factor antagonist